VTRRRPKRPPGQFRLSQLVTTYGPGAAADLPRDSVLIGGLEQWEPRGPMIHEARLVQKIARLFPMLQDIHLHSPPPAKDLDEEVNGVGAWLFPEWFLVVRAVVSEDRRLRSRRLVHRTSLSGRAFVDDDKKKVQVVPIRFVRACVRGHIDDIPWYQFVHGDGNPCRRTLWLDERGTSGDVGDLAVRCECGMQRRITDATVKGANILGHCNGLRPWLGRNEREKCDQMFRLLVRTASNAYFTQSMSVISLPDPEEMLAQAINPIWEDFLQELETKDELVKKRARNEKVKKALAGLSDDRVWNFLEQRRSGERVDRSVKEVEFEVLSDSKEEVGSDRPEGDFYARALPADELKGKHVGVLEKVVLVHRLREVQALVGFTRFESLTPSTDGELEAGVQRAALARDPQWFPAIETRGEGIFLLFRPEAIAAWAKRPAVVQRAQELLAGFELWKEERPNTTRKFCGVEYLLLHSLSHLLITAVSLGCGYPGSSIRERIYALEQGYGILLYTATSDAEGTLGGLVEVGRRIGQYLDDALESGRLCSNDPVCAQHEAKDPHEQRFLHGASCHGCLLISETSCEMRNDFLDRALVVPTVAGVDAEFFEMEKGGA
jgi:hypothetical protein